MSLNNQTVKFEKEYCIELYGNSICLYYLCVKNIILKTNFN